MRDCLLRAPVPREDDSEAVVRDGVGGSLAASRYSTIPPSASPDRTRADRTRSGSSFVDREAFEFAARCAERAGGTIDRGPKRRPPADSGMSRRAIESAGTQSGGDECRTLYPEFSPGPEGPLIGVPGA